MYPAYNGDSLYIVIRNETRGRNAGSNRPNTQFGNSPCLVTLDVTSWTDSEIQLNGFSGDYGKNGWILNDGDIIEVLVWNPNTGLGPALCMVAVGNNPATCQQ